MNSPRPCSYHQKPPRWPRSSASSALKIRLRSSVRWATRVIVAAASRGARRRRSRGLRPPRSVRPCPMSRARSGRVRAGCRPRGTARRAPAPRRRAPRRSRASSCSCAVRSPLAGASAATISPRSGVLARPWRGRPCGRLAGVVVLHALHLALEDPQRAAERAGGVRQLLVAEQQQDHQDDRDDLQRAERHDGILQRWVAGAMLRPGAAATRRSHPVGAARSHDGQSAFARRAAAASARAEVACSCSRTGCSVPLGRPRPRGAAGCSGAEQAVRQDARGRPGRGRPRRSTPRARTADPNRPRSRIRVRRRSARARRGRRRPPGRPARPARRRSAPPPSEATSRRAQARSAVRR